MGAARTGAGLEDADDLIADLEKGFERRRFPLPPIQNAVRPCCRFVAGIAAPTEFQYLRHCNILLFVKRICNLPRLAESIGGTG